MNGHVIGGLIPEDIEKRVRSIMADKGIIASEAVRQALALWCTIVEAGK